MKWMPMRRSRGEQQRYRHLSLGGLMDRVEGLAALHGDHSLAVSRHQRRVNVSRCASCVVE